MSARVQCGTIYFRFSLFSVIHKTLFTVSLNIHTEQTVNVEYCSKIGTISIKAFLLLNKNYTAMRAHKFLNDLGGFVMVNEARTTVNGHRSTENHAHTPEILEKCRQLQQM